VVDLHVLCESWLKFNEKNPSLHLMCVVCFSLFYFAIARFES
jgi:hypothetical protein